MELEFGMIRNSTSPVALSCTETFRAEFSTRSHSIPKVFQLYSGIPLKFRELAVGRITSSVRKNVLAWNRFEWDIITSGEKSFRYRMTSSMSPSKLPPRVEFPPRNRGLLSLGSKPEYEPLPSSLPLIYILAVEPDRTKARWTHSFMGNVPVLVTS